MLFKSLKIQSKRKVTFCQLLSFFILFLTYSVSSVVSSSGAYAQSNELELPRQMAWTAYNLGTTGYNQSVGIGAMLKDKYGVTLRVIPGQNDISR